MIDVSELMDDPDFVSPDPVQVERRAVAVNEHGETELTPTVLDITAIVQDGAGDMLERMPEAAKLVESIRVWSRFQFESESVGGYADVVLYRGKRYQVMPRNFWANWGNGYTRVLATLEGFSQ